MTDDRPECRTLVYVDMAYTWKILRHRRHEDFWHARHADGYFDHVIGVNPLADVADGEVRRRTRLGAFSPTQMVIEGTSQACRLPAPLLPLNFLISQLALLWGLVRRLRSRLVTAVYATDPLYSGLFALALARMIKRPLAIFIAAEYDEIYRLTGKLGYPRVLRSRRVEQAVMRLVLRRADMVVAAAESVASLARRYGARPERIARLGHGKFLARVHMQPPSERSSADCALADLGIPSRSPFLVYVGRLQALKQPDHALRAMAIALRQVPGAVAVMAGDGEMRAELERLARELGIAERTYFPGLIDQHVLASILPRAVTVSPITGMALMECALAGSPIIAYDRDWQADFVSNGRTGFVIPEGDWEGLGEAAAVLLRDPVLSSRMGQAGRRRALAFTDHKRNMRREHAAFDKMLAQFERQTRTR